MARVAPDWYESFFSGLSLEVWRRAMTPEITRAEVDFLLDVLDCAPGARLLDVPCGNGRHALELAARGHRVTGVDRSPVFLDEARAAAATTGFRVDWLLEDMRRLPRDASFDGAYCLGNSFGYFDHAGTVDFVGAVASALRAGASFVIDTHTVAESILPDFDGEDSTRVDDILVRTRQRYVARESRLDVTHTFTRDGLEQRRESSHRVYTVAELCRLLTEAGFEPRKLYGSVDGERYELGSPRLLLVASKR